MEPDTFHVTEGRRSRRDKAHAKSGTAPVMLRMSSYHQTRT